jgi:hypothetical protein
MDVQQLGIAFITSLKVCLQMLWSEPTMTTHNQLDTTDNSKVDLKDSGPPYHKSLLSHDSPFDTEV